MKLNATRVLAAGALALTAGAAQADQIINDDLIVTFSACIGNDCVNGESFGFDTLKLKENNLRIKFDDTSVSASFPRNDWQITANDTSNGGANKFSIDDITGGRTPFTIEAAAPSHSLYVDDGGRIGVGTSTPVVEIHVPDGDTPTLRLEQDGSSGFAPQTWDVAGNEANFFIRDVSNGSALPFRIQAGAPGNTFYIANDGAVGIGDITPDEKLDVEGGNIRVEQDGPVNLTLADTSSTGTAYPDFRLQYEGGTARMSFVGTGSPELELKRNGNVVLSGECLQFNRGGSTFACTFAANTAPACGSVGSVCN